MSDPLRLGASVGFWRNPGSLAERARGLEQAGVDYLWCGEAYSADGVSSMGYLAAVTERANIGSSILPIYTRTPSLIAMTALGLDRLSNGRFVLGLGASGPQVIEGLHGVPYDFPLGRTSEIVEICRSAWRRERVQHDGRHFRIPLAEGQGTGLGKPLKLIDGPTRPQIPIFVASLGPKNVELTAAIAEGWMPLHFWPDRAKSIWGNSLTAGLERRPVDLPPLEVVAGGQLAIGHDLEHLREKARPMLGLYFGGMGARGKNFYNDLLKRYGFEAEADAIQDAYLGGDRKGAAAMIPRELIDGMSLVGSPGFVKERIEAYREAGVTILNVDPVGPNGLRDVETVAGWLA